MTEYHLPDQTSIGYVILRVADLERSLGFYRDLLGLQADENPDGSVALRASPDEPPFLLLVEQPDAISRPRRSAGLYHIAIRYPSREALGWALRRLAQSGYPIQGGADHGVSEAIYTSDPDGNGIELYRDRPREEWPREGDQVTMFTDALDAQGVMGAGEGMGQSASPVGVDMGHVHLQVSDLDQARRFFHDHLGLDITQASYPGALFMSAGGYHHHVGMNTWAGQGIPPTPENAPGLVAFSLALPDSAARQELIDRLQAQGISGWWVDVPGVGRVWRISAPDGVMVDLTVNVE